MLFPDSPAPEEDSNQFSIAVIALINFLLHIPFLFKSLLLVRFLNVFEQSILCLPRLHLFDQIYIKNSNIVKLLQFKITILF